MLPVFPPLGRPFLKLLLLLLLLLASRLPGRARPPARYQLATAEKPVALLPAGRATYLITEHSVFELGRRQLVRRYQSEALIRCALATDTALWLGTQQGALRLSIRHFAARRLSLPDAAGQAPITALCRDAGGRIWVGALGFGVFRQADATVNSPFESVLSVPTVSAALATTDSSVWIGSSLGLNRFRRGAWTRYNEEGVAGLEIPDNLVDKLLPDNAGNFWVLMSAGISVFPGGGTAAPAAPAELPTATFIGWPGNEVFSVASLPGLGRVFATAMGPLLLPENPAGPFASFEPAASDKVEPKRALLPLRLPGENLPYLIQTDPQQRVWVVSAGEVRVWSAKAFRQLTQAQLAKPVLTKLAALPGFR